MARMAPGTALAILLSQEGGAPYQPFCLILETELQSLKVVPADWQAFSCGECCPNSYPTIQKESTFHLSQTIMMLGIHVSFRGCAYLYLKFAPLG